MTLAPGLPAAYIASMADKHPKRPRDPNQLAKHIIGIATGEVSDAPPPDDKDPAAVSLGRRGGLKGGRARADGLLPERRSEIARKAAQSRWKKESGDG